jgi:hypothetical protein
MGKYEQRNMGDAFGALIAIAMALVFCLMITLCSGCKTRYITQEVPVVVHERDSIYKVNTLQVHDTLIYRDSVFHMIKGDTVLIERWHNLQAINHVARVDTVYKDRNVEVPVTVTKTEVCEVNKLHWWQQALMWLGALALGAGGGLLYWRFRRR